jgi:tetratricopeptide (TPR) repeat protein
MPRKLQIFVSERTYSLFRERIITLGNLLWHVIGWIWGSVIIGGFIINIVISFVSTGTSGLSDPRSWFLVKPLLAYPVQSLLLLFAASFLTVLIYLCHRYKQQEQRKQQYAHNESLIDIAKGVRRLLEDSTYQHASTDIDRASTRQEATAHPVTIWSVPYRRNPFFTGREQILAHIHNRLTKKTNTRALIQAQAISGLGGTGKTQAAIEYAYRYRHDYNFVFWVRAATYDTLLTDFITIADLLHLPEKNEQDQNKVVAAVRQWMITHEDWLLILDNADDLTMVDNILPSEWKGHVLLTTRTQIGGTVANMIELEKMSTAEGILLLLRRARILEAEGSLDQVTPQDSSDAEAIVKELDCLPLAIDQAGAYIEETQCSLSAYLPAYQTQRRHLLQRRGTFPADHPEPVTTTWSLSFQKVEAVSPASVDLLRFCAFLDPDAIPEEIFTEGPLNLGSVLQSLTAEPLRLNEAIEQLRKFSLVKRNPRENTLSIHRLVQAVLIDDMDIDVQILLAARAIRVINHVFPHVEVETELQCRRLFPQVLACATLIKRYELESAEAARLLDEAGIYLHDHALYQEAETFYLEALNMREKVLGADHISTADSLNDLGLLYRDQGKYKETEPLLHRALLIREKALGAEHPATAMIFNNLGLLYRDQGMYSEAEMHLQRAVNIRKKVLGTEHPATAISLGNLGLLYRDLGRYEEAEPLLKQALLTREKVFGVEHPATATSLNYIAGLYHTQGKYKEAEVLYQQALSIRERVIGVEHPATAMVLHNLADLYRDVGRYSDSEALYRQALEIRERVLGPKHPATVLTLENYAVLLRKMNRSEEAKAIEVRINQIRAKQA